MTAVTLNEFQEFAEQRIAEGQNNPEKFSSLFQEIMDFAVANEKAMDEEAKAFYQKLLSQLTDSIDDVWDSHPDSPHRRKVLRAIALVREKHHRADGFAEGLGRPLPTPFAVAEEAKPIFLSALQSVLDVLFDATRQPQEGAAQFGTVSMLYWAVDELNVAFYLAERKYATQTYSHLRTVYDLLEKVELLFKQPKWGEVWASDDYEKIRHEFAPGEVRKKLGRPKFDAVYSFLSTLGSHGTFEAVRRRVAKTGHQANRTQFAIWIGGVPWDTEVDVSVSLCLFAVTSTLIMAISVFENRLHRDEAAQILERQSKSTIDFLGKHLVKLAEESGIDASGLIECLKSIPLSRPS